MAVIGPTTTAQHVQLRQFPFQLAVLSAELFRITVIKFCRFI
jgi:hypothetical protein